MPKGNVKVENKRYDLVPPDGGWGNMICVASVINFIAITMFLAAFGMIYKDFLIEIDMGSASVMLMNGICMMCSAFAGLFASALTKLLGIRVLAFIGAFLFNIGVFCTIFVKTKAWFFVCQAVQTCGMGLLYNTTSTQITNYFLKKRLLIFCITNTMAAASGTIGPYLVEWCMNSFGYRETLVMVSAVSLQTFIAVALMQPVARHLLKVEVETTTEEMNLLIEEKNIQDATVTTPTITLTDTDKSFESKINIANDDLQKRNKSKDKHLSNVLDVQLIKQFIFSNATMGPTFCLFADTIFSMMLPQALYAMDWSEANVAQAIFLSGLGDLITRASFIFLSNWLNKVGYQEVFLVGVFIAFASRLCMLWSENTVLVKIFITLLGISRCTINVFPPLIFAEIFSPDKFSSVLGIYVMFFAIINLILGPVIGAIRDLTDSYSTAFFIITSCFAVVLLLWSIELLYKRNKHKRVLQKEAAERLKKANVKNVKNKSK